MELPTMPHERRHTNQLLVIRQSTATHMTPGQYPGIDTVGFPHLCQLLSRLLQAQPTAHRCRFPSLFNGDGCELVQGMVEPAFANFKRREAMVPLPTFALARGRPDILHHKGTHREDLTENRGNAQFPRPSRPGRGRQFVLAPMAVLARLATRGLSSSTRATHAGTGCLRFLDPLPGLCLNIEVGMCRREDAVPLTLG